MTAFYSAAMVLCGLVIVALLWDIPEMASPLLTIGLRR